MSQKGVQLPPTDDQNPLNLRLQQEINIAAISRNHIRPRPDLIKASIKGDWKAAKEILDKRPELVRYSLTGNGETALHVAASAESTKHVEEFVENLVNYYMEKKDLELQAESDNTALCTAAASGNVKIVRIMVEKNSELVEIPGKGNMMALYMAALYGNYEVVKYLYEKSDKLWGDGWKLENRGMLLLKCVETDMFDIVLRILTDWPELVSSGNVLLGALARKTNAFAETQCNIIMTTIKWFFTAISPKLGSYEKKSTALELLTIIWKNITEKPEEEIDDILRGPPDNMVKIQKTNFESTNGASTNPNPLSPQIRNQKYSSRIPFIVAEMGNTRFLIELIRLYPDLIWKVNDNNQSIFHIAAQHRHEGIYNLLYEIGSKKNQIIFLKDTNDNNMLHLVGKCAKKKRLKNCAGAAFQVQRELLWFKEVEKMVPLAYHEERNKDGLTPQELFSMEHKDLFKEGEEWMKRTSSQCMVVGALIATIVFAAAFTVPGGYNQNNGIPIFYRNITFMVFVVADAISFISSSISVLMFLFIITSRYAERDFLESIPKKVFLAVATLTLSIVTMMVAFIVSFFVLYYKDVNWIPILVILFATMPILIFSSLQFPLLNDVFHSAYDSTYLFRPKKRALYYGNSMSNSRWFPFKVPFISKCTLKMLKSM